MLLAQEAPPIPHGVSNFHDEQRPSRPGGPAADARRGGRSRPPTTSSPPSTVQKGTCGSRASTRASSGSRSRQHRSPRAWLARAACPRRRLTPPPPALCAGPGGVRGDARPARRRGARALTRRRAPGSAGGAAARMRSAGFPVGGSEEHESPRGLERQHAARVGSGVRRGAGSPGAAGPRFTYACVARSPASGLGRAPSPPQRRAPPRASPRQHG